MNGELNYKRLFRLAQDAANENWVKRQDALHSIWDLAAENSAEEVIRLARLIARALLSDPIDTVRSDAVGALGEFGNKSDWFAITACIEDKSWAVRAWAASAMADLFGKRGLPSIRRLLRDKSGVVRKYAAVALFDVLGSAAADDVKTLLVVERDLNARIGYYYVLAASGDSHAKEQLQSLTKHPKARISSAARRCLEDLPVKSPNSKPARTNRAASL